MSTLTCSQINEAIARLLDEEQYDETWDGEEERLFINYPDYCHSWGAVVVLLEEMVNDHTMHLWASQGWHCGDGGVGQHSDGHGSCLTEAIARAYHAWKSAGC